MDPIFIQRLANALAARIIPNIPQSDGKLQPRLLTAAEAAVFLGRRSPGAIYHLASRGGIPFIKQGRSIRFDVEDLRIWISRGKNGQRAEQQIKEKTLRKAKGANHG